MAKFKYIGAPHDVEVCFFQDGREDGYEWVGYTGGGHRYRLVFSTAEGPEYAGYAVCLGDATEAPPPQPTVRGVLTVYLASGQRCEWPLNKPEEMRVVFHHDSGVLEVRSPRGVPPSFFADDSWTFCGVALVEQPS